MAEASELVGIGEAARILKVHRSQVDRFIQRGRLQAVTLPAGYRRTGKWRYLRREEVEQLAADTSWRKPRPRD